MFNMIALGYASDQSGRDALALAAKLEGLLGEITVVYPYSPLLRTIRSDAVERRIRGEVGSQGDSPELARATYHLHLTPSSGSPLAPRGVRVRVGLAEDHPLMRRGLRTLLEDEQDLQVVFEAHDAPTASRLLCESHPRVLVLGLSLPATSGVRIIWELRERSPESEIVLVTMNESAVLAHRALAAGAIGFVMKDSADVELAPAVRAATHGQQYVSPQVAPRLAALLCSLVENRLTAREVEVLMLVVLGHTTVEIAPRLAVSARTVETHRARLLGKLGLTTRAELVHYALGCNLLGA